ncbi:hypothetical protein BLNAU_21263 [Blattamonas nauphoetae]|uniref:Uncharacterized protein n=1 Tax=Blattamonas nauphoetae TaxID=2049346 RepID=A0ABQ9X0K7_9EUKA|nr:hypothetical protein BLNAU_21263 [Blattamonas nauphoetae]
MIISQICGDSEQLRPLMLKSLFVLVSESDWALSTILDVEYIKPLEQYCAKTQPRHVPIALPKLLSLIGKTSTGELDRICASSLPSFLLEWLIANWNDKMHTEFGNCLILLTSTLRSSYTFLANHNTKLLDFVEDFKTQEFSPPLLTMLARMCFSPHFTISNESLKVLNSQSRSDPATRSFLQTLEVPCGSTDSSSELVPFAGRLCTTLAEQVAQLQSLFTKASQSDPTSTALSATPPEESTLLIGKAKLNVEIGLHRLATFTLMVRFKIVTDILRSMLPLANIH